jgi:type I restriction enzyme S subunit
MHGSDTIFPAELRTAVEKNMVGASRLVAAQFRLDAPAFLSRDEFLAFIPSSSKSRPLSQLADVFTVYIQSPILAYVRPFANSRPYMTTSELAENQNGRTTHVSLLADPRLMDWEIKHRNIVVSRSGRVGEAYWVDKKLGGALVGDSFRVVPKKPADGPFIYVVLASSFARNFLSGSAYGSVIDHASLEQLRNFPMPEVTASVKSKITKSMGRALASRERASDLLDQVQVQLLKANNLLPMDTNPADVLTVNADVVNFMVTPTDLAQSAASASEFRLEAHFHNPVTRLAIARIEKSPSKKLTVGEISHDVIMGGRFKRNYVESAYGTPFLSGKNIAQIRPTDLKYLSNSETEDLNKMLVKRGWILVTCSGTIGRTCFVWHNFENYAASQHILRVLPDNDQIDPGYLYAFLASDYGYFQTIRFRHGSVIDEITDKQLKKVIVPVPSRTQQKEIGDVVRLAYEKRAEALRLDEESQALLLRELKESIAKEK